MKRTLLLLMFCFLALAAFAGENKNPKATKSATKSMAAPTPAAKAGSWVLRRFELSIQGGGVIGGNLGEPDYGNCTSSVAGGCDDSVQLHHDNVGQYGIYPGLLGGLKYFQRRGGITPGNGALWGVRAAYNLTPHWQLEFMFNHAQTATAFSNQEMLDLNVQTFNLQGFGNFPRYIENTNGFDGRPHGNQNQYLLNINRLFNTGGRFVPYIGAGLGWVDWYAGPKFNALVVTQEPAVTQFYKGSDDAAGSFAFDVAAGAKYHLTPNFGVRGDVTDVLSFPRINNQARSTLIGGNLIPLGLNPISGTIQQNGKFNQLSFTGGVFYQFGGALDAEQSSGIPDDGSRWFDRWELSLNFGGVHGWKNGNQSSQCVAASTNGCSLADLQNLIHDNFTGGVYPSRILSTVPNFLNRGGVKPGDGWTTGLRLTYNVTHDWDLAFIWQTMGTGTAFDNRFLLDQAQTNFDTGDINANPPRSLQYVGNADGRARGNQTAYLFNFDRNFHLTKRFVPYIGAGLGMETWSGGPRVDLRADLTGSNVGNVADFNKVVRGQNSFAFDIAGGMKYYLTRHWGVRADVMDVFSFNDFQSDFATIDTSGQYGTPGAALDVSGSLRQTSRISQLVTTAGVFWSFWNGGDWKAEKKSIGNVSGGGHGGRFELSLQSGGIVGGNLGEPDYGKCTSTATGGLDGCDINQNLKLNGSSGVYPGAFGSFRNFQRQGGVTAGDGGFYGARLGWNITPQWELEFIFNHTQSNTSFSNEQSLFDATNYRIQRFNGSTENAKAAEVLGNADGAPRGNQNQWLANLNRNFNVSGRIVPYIGGGIGAEQWLAGPAANLWVQNNENGSWSQFYKFSGNGTGFAADFATGAKMWLTNNFGVRADFTDVVSWVDLTHTYASLDQADFQGFGPGSMLPISGRSTQSGRFNQAMFSGGVFWSLGGRLDTSKYKKPTGDRESMNDHWELSLNFGGAHGSQFGNSGTTCNSSVTGGCDTTQPLDHDTTGGTSVFPGRLSGTLPFFMSEKGIKPGDGWTSGIQVAYNFTPNWQIAMIYNQMGLGMRFENEGLLRQSLDAFWAQCDCNTPRALNFNGNFNGSARGNQQQWLVNLNRNFHVNSRVVPYIGGGMGVTSFHNNPLLSLETTTRGPNGNSLGNVAQFNKGIPSETQFALDLAAGLKFYVSRHWGFRADMLNVVNFGEFHPTFSTIDVTGVRGPAASIVPVTGTLTQSSRINTTSGTGGVFVTF